MLPLPVLILALPLALLLVDVALPTLFSETVLLFVAARCAAMRIPRVFSSAADIIKHKYYI
jgi:hypothetical protein